MSAPDEEYTKDVLQWVKQQVAEGDKFLEQQYGYSDIEKSIAYIQGEQKDKVISNKLANFTLNHVGKVTNDLVASLTDIKPLFSWNSHNIQMQDQVQILNKLGISWWLNNFIDLKFGGGIQIAIPSGCSYLYVYWNPDLAGGRGDVDVMPLDPRDVLPIRPTSSISIQDSLGVIMRSVKTVHELRAKYPHLANQITADSDVAYSPAPRQTAFARVFQSVMTPVHSVLQGTNKAKSAMRVPGTEVYTVFLKDDAINETNSPRTMGYSEDEEHNWDYVVQPGDPLYPRGRCIVCSRDMIFYDGPNPYWHGRFPLVKMPMDLSFFYPDSYLSKSVMSDVIPIQDMINELMDGVIDAVRKALKPGVIADKRAVAEATLRKLNTREPGHKMRINPVAGLGIKYEDPPIIPPYIFDVMQFLIERLEYISGSIDMTNLSKVKQLPSEEAVEAIMSAMTPMTRLRGRILEAVIRELAELVKYNFFQFYDAKRRLAILGPDGITFEDFDFDPANLIPDDIPGENRYERAIKHASNFAFYITPNSMLEVALVSQKILYLQLRRMGEIDHDTFLEMMEVPNIPQVNQRLGSELDQKILMAQQLQAGTPGRKPTAQKLPNLEVKGDGRPVVAES